METWIGKSIQGPLIHFEVIKEDGSITAKSLTKQGLAIKVAMCGYPPIMGAILSESPIEMIRFRMVGENMYIPSPMKG